MALKVFRGIDLDISAVTKTFGFMGIRESGKTYAGTKLLEEMHQAGAQVVALDPVGKWWGLRLGIDGKSPGRDIPILGGLRGDIPLEPTAGRLIAQTVVDTGTSVILDLSQMRKNKRKTFVTDFCEEIFHLRAANPSAMHMFFEESHLFAPQRETGQEQMLGAVEDIVRLGRNHGIGASLIDQRPQSVNKNVLNQVECLCVLRIVGRHERKAIMEWVTHAGIDVADMANQLAELETGQCMVWSPSWLKVFQKTRVLKKKTFDASATPKVGVKQSQGKLKPLDLKHLGKAMTQMVEILRESDPKVLKQEIKALKARLERAQKATHTTDQLQSVQRKGYIHGWRKASEYWGAVVDNTLRRAGEYQSVARSAGEQLSGMYEDVKQWDQIVRKRMEELQTPHDYEANIDGFHSPPAAVAAVDGGTGDFEPMTGEAVGRTLTNPEVIERLASSNGELKPAHQKILNAIGWFRVLGRERVKRAQIAFIAGYRIAGGFNNYLGFLRSQGYIDYPAPAQVCLTAKGEQHAQIPERPPTSNDLQQKVLSKLSPASKRSALEVLIRCYPQAITRPELAKAVGMKIAGGFNNYVGSLCSLGLVEKVGKGSVKAHDDLFV